MRLFRSIVFLLVAVLAACAQQPARHARPIDYDRYVEYSVGSFGFSTLHDWDSNDPGHVVVWVSPIEAYRLTLLGSCLGLQYAQVIGLTSHRGEVSAHRDAVVAGGDHCPIALIQRLDARAIRALRAKPKSSGGKGG